MKSKIYFHMTLAEAYEWYVDGGVSVVCDGDTKSVSMEVEYVS
jgi:hypothetical protein